MQFKSLSAVVCFLTVLLTVGASARAAVVGEALLNDVNGNGTPTLSDAESIHVTLDHDPTGSATSTGDVWWSVSVSGASTGDYTAFREFYFSYDPGLTISDVEATGPNASSWSLVEDPNASAGSFGKFGFLLDSTPASLEVLTFNILVDGTFQPNADQFMFVAKNASNGPGGFVAADSISAVPLPAAVWIFLSGLAGMGMLVSRRRRLLLRDQL